MGLRTILQCDAENCETEHSLPSSINMESGTLRCLLPKPWRLHRQKVVCSDQCADTLDTITVEEALESALQYGTGTASGYLSALGGMGSKYNLGKGDEAAAKVRQRWRDTLKSDLLSRLESSQPPQPKGHPISVRMIELAEQVLKGSAPKSGAKCELALLVLAFRDQVINT